MNRAMAWSRTEKPDSLHHFTGRLTGSESRTRSLLIGRTLLAVSLGAIALAAWGWFHFNDEKSLADTSKALIDALKAGNAGATTAILASSQVGTALLEKEVARVQAKPPTDGAKPVRSSANPTLDQVREALSKEGVDWNNLQPLAFGGVKAQVADTSTMKTYSTVATGEIYFASGQALFAVEFTARKCGSVFVITDIWQYHAIEIPKEKLAEYSNKRFREFTDEPDDPKDSITMRSPKHIFFAF